jgi:hypothetical protein
VRPTHEQADGAAPPPDENAVALRFVVPVGILDAICLARQQLATAQKTAQAQQNNKPN